MSYRYTGEGSNTQVLLTLALQADECSTETTDPFIPWAKTPRTQQRRSRWTPEPVWTWLYTEKSPHLLWSRTWPSSLWPVTVMTVLTCQYSIKTALIIYIYIYNKFTANLNYQMSTIISINYRSIHIYPHIHRCNCAY